MEFIRCASREEALTALRQHGSDATLLAGGADAMLQIQRGDITPSVLLHVGRVPRAAIAANAADWLVDALTTHVELATHERFSRAFAAISGAAATVGGWQTQCIGTLGGNICNASPAADLLAPLLVHDANVHLESATSGTIQMPLEEFVVGRRRTRRCPDQLLSSITLSNPPPHTADVYVKVGRRSGMEVAIVGLAVRLTLASDLKTISDIRIAACSVGPIPFRARSAESILRNCVPDQHNLAAAGAALVADARPINDRRGSAQYRIAVLPRLLERAVYQVVAHVAGRA